MSSGSTISKRASTRRIAVSALAVLGNVELDLRQVLLPPGLTHLHVRSILGNIEITLPPDLPVECDGSGILGTFTGVNRVPVEGGHDGPRLRITGTAILGSVAIHMRPRYFEHASPCRKRPRQPALPPRRS